MQRLWHKMIRKERPDVYEDKDSHLKGMGLDLDNIDTEQVGNFITRFFDAIMGFFNKLFG